MDLAPARRDLGLVPGVFAEGIEAEVGVITGRR